MANPENLEKTETFLAKTDLTDEERKVLNIFKRTFECYTVPLKHATVVRPLKEELVKLEGALERKAGSFDWTYVNDNGEVVKTTRKALFAILRSNEHEPIRKSCWQTIEKFPAFIASDFVQVVRLRNKIARTLGYKNYYDYKVRQAEGMSQEELFSLLDDLENKTRSLNMFAMAELAASKGASALEPWNVGYMAGGGTAAKLTDKYFPFAQAVDVWARTFAGLGITYRGATLNLDLCDRQGKYPNGFCHWPQVAWNKPNGAWQPSIANFTSLASPNVAGSGGEALTTLLHEGGHAAHFANVQQPSPFFGQERAPMSVAYAETQSMFLDALYEDADWRARFAIAEDGEVMPFDVHAECIRESHPYAVRGLRRMLAVCYYEKAIYDLADDDSVSAEVLLDLCRKSDHSVMGKWQSMPTLLIPHLLSDESSAYYHGYVLAEMAVQHTRQYFLKKFGRIVDVKNVGEELRHGYWLPGNSERFLNLVNNVTGSPLSSDAWVHDLSQSVTDKIDEEKIRYEEGLKAGAAVKKGANVDKVLDVHIKLVHGDDTIADSQLDGSASAACDKFAKWVDNEFLKK